MSSEQSLSLGERVAPARRARLLLLAALGGLFGLSVTSEAAQAAPKSGDPLRALAARYHTPLESLSAIVQAVDAEKPLYQLNVRVPRNPASTAKLITTFVALDTLGPGHVWRTELHAMGKVSNGTLEGDLLIRGGGDPWLTEERFWTLLGQLRARGVARITGDLLIDGSRFAPPARGPGDFDGQPWRLYNVMPHAALMNFKAVNLEFHPAPAGDRVDIRTTPALPGFTIENRLRATQEPCRGIEAELRIEVPEPERADRIVVEGRYPLACGTQALLRTYLTPETYAHALFQRLWAQWGGQFEGGVRSAVRPAGHPPFLVGESAPLAELIRPLNKWSNNPMADAVFLAIGAEPGTNGLSATRAEAAVHAYFRAHGLPADGLVLENGSGLSRHSRVSAASMGALLRHAWHSRYMPEFVASLSIVGVDGTLRKRLTQPPERGWMHLKSGYIDKVSAVSGYVRARSGKTYVVSFFLNGPSPAGRALGDALLRWTWQH